MAERQGQRPRKASLFPPFLHHLKADPVLSQFQRYLCSLRGDPARGLNMPYQGWADVVARWASDTPGL